MFENSEWDILGEHPETPPTIPGDPRSVTDSQKVKSSDQMFKIVSFTCGT